MYILTHKVTKVNRADAVLVNAASGGVGIMLVQMAKQLGAKQIIGVVGNMKKAEIVYELGADEYTEDNGGDIVFDSIAGDVTEESFNCLASYGTLVQFDNSGGRAGLIKTSDLHSSCRNVKGFSLGTTRKLHPEMLQTVAEEIFALLKGEVLQVPIAKIYKLEKMQEAHEFMESRQHQGKILIKVV